MNEFIQLGNDEENQKYEYGVRVAAVVLCGWMPMLFENRKYEYGFLVVAVVLGGWMPMLLESQQYE